MGDKEKGYSKTSTNKSNGNERLDIYNTDGHPVPGDNHSSFHAEKNSDGTIDMTFNNRETGETTKTSCFITSACMSRYSDCFDDNCYELTVLRWFRDNFVSEEDKINYYQIAPSIVSTIEQEKYKDLIYDYLFDNVVSYCITAIENGDYNAAYDRYRSSVLSLENKFVKKSTQEHLPKKLTLQPSN